MTEYDSRIPEKLQLLRVGLGGKDDLAVFAYYPSAQQTNFANPSFCLAPSSDDPDTMDVSGAIEQTLHDLLDYGATTDDVRQVMGLVPESELDATALEHDECIAIDLAGASMATSSASRSCTRRRRMSMPSSMTRR